MLRTLLWAVLVALVPSIGLAQPAVRRTADGGAIVTTQQTHRGIPVVGAGTITRLDDAGHTRWQWSSERAISRSFSIVPLISRESAIARVSPQGATVDAMLVIWAPAALTPRLAWRITLPFDLAQLRAMQFHVDAHDGHVLSSENLVEGDRQALVYEESPITTPDLSTVTLESLPVGATQLDDPELVGRTCVDRGQCMPITGVPGAALHVCDLEPTALADASGDFLIPPPADPLAIDDAFAEVQLYRHASRALAFFHSLGLPFGRPTPLVLVANLRMAAFDPSDCAGGTPTSALLPFDNAFYAPAGALAGFPPSDALLFGQGTTLDFSYDGDVVVHEMTHAAVASLASFSERLPDLHGLDTSPAAMNEGFADYFAAVVNGNADIGEHAGGSGGALRSIDGTSTCPLSLSGDAHDDSVIWSGALWESRAALDALDRTTFDRVVFEVLTTITMADTWLTVGARLGVAATATLGPAQGATVSGVLMSRGLVDCAQRVIDTATQPVQPRLQLTGTEVTGTLVVPGPVQYRLVLDEDAIEIRASMASFEAAVASVAPEVTVILKAGDEPIHWSFDGVTPTHDAIATTEITPSGTGASGTLTGDFPAGTYHLMFVDTHGSARATDVTFLSIDAPVDGGTTDAGVDASATDASPTADAGSAPMAASGCGCRVESTRVTPSLGLLLVAGLASVLRARRRR